MKRRAAGQAPGKYDVGALLCHYDYKCRYCQCEVPPYHIDHVVPIAKGGTNDLDNLAILCPTCNMKKGVMSHEAFLVSKRRKVVRW